MTSTQPSPRRLRQLPSLGSLASPAVGTRLQPLGRVTYHGGAHGPRRRDTVAPVTLTSTVDMAEAVRFQAQLDPNSSDVTACAWSMTR